MSKRKVFSHKVTANSLKRKFEVYENPHIPLLYPYPFQNFASTSLWPSECNGFCLLKYKVDRTICLIRSKEPFRRSRGHFIFVMVCLMLCSTILNSCLCVREIFDDELHINEKRICNRVRGKGQGTWPDALLIRYADSFTRTTRWKSNRSYWSCWPENVDGYLVCKVWVFYIKIWTNNWITMLGWINIYWNLKCLLNFEVKLRVLLILRNKIRVRIRG